MAEAGARVGVRGLRMVGGSEGGPEDVVGEYLGGTGLLAVDGLTQTTYSSGWKRTWSNTVSSIFGAVARGRRLLK